MKRLVVPVLALGFALAACTSHPSKPKAASPTPSVTPSPAPSSPAAAAPRVTVLYNVGAYAQYGYFQIGADGSRKTRLDDALFANYYSFGSPDGRFIARAPYYQDVANTEGTHADLTIAAAHSPGSMHRVVRVKDALIGSVLWSGDSSTLVYTTLRRNPNDNGETLITKLYVVSRDGSGRRLIADISHSSYDLRAVDLRAKKIYLAEGAAIVAISMSNGTEHDIAGLDKVPYGYAFDRDATHLFYPRGHTVVERTIRNGHERIVYRSNVAVAVQGVSPLGDAITMNVGNDGVPGKEYILDLSSGEAVRLRYGTKDVGAARWSPDGKHLWIDCACAAKQLVRGLLFDIDTGAYHVIGDGHHSNDATMWMMMWLVV